MRGEEEEQKLIVKSSEIKKLELCQLIKSAKTANST